MTQAIYAKSPGSMSLPAIYSIINQGKTRVGLLARPLRVGYDVYNYVGGILPVGRFTVVPVVIACASYSAPWAPASTNSCSPPPQREPARISGRWGWVVGISQSERGSTSALSSLTGPLTTSIKPKESPTLSGPTKRDAPGRDGCRHSNLGRRRAAISVASSPSLAICPCPAQSHRQPIPRQHWQG